MRTLLLLLFSMLQFFPLSLTHQLHKLECLPREPFLKWRLSALVLLELPSLDKQLLMMQTVFNNLQKATLMSLTVLGLLLQVVFLGLPIQSLLDHVLSNIY
jgi:hypothetical protein